MKRTSTKQRVLVAVGAGAVGWLLILGAVAYACTAQATMKLRQSSGSPGATIQGTGSNFSRALVGPSEEVKLRWNGTSAMVLWAGAPDAEGRIAFEFKVPATATNGYYSIVATQGSLVGRTPFQVVGGQPGSASPSDASDRGSTNAPPSGEGSGSTEPSEGAQSEGDDSPTSPAATDGSGRGTAAPAPASQPGRTPQPAATARSTGTSSASEAPATATPAGELAAPASEEPAVVEVSDPPAVAPASVAADMWSGFRSGAAPSLVGPQATPSRPQSSLAGMALFGTGLLAMMVGASVAGLRRRQFVMPK